MYKIGMLLSNTSQGNTWGIPIYILIYNGIIIQLDDDDFIDNENILLNQKVYISNSKGVYVVGKDNHYYLVSNYDSKVFKDSKGRDNTKLIKVAHIQNNLYNIINNL